MKPSLKIKFALWGGWLFGLTSLMPAAAQSTPSQPSAFVPAPVAISSRVDTVRGQKYRVHIVQHGHTLYSIARAYQVGLREIVKRSGGDTVRVDEALYIPYKTIEGGTPVSADTFYTAARPLVFPDEYPIPTTGTPRGGTPEPADHTPTESTGELSAAVPTASARPEPVASADTTASVTVGAGDVHDDDGGIGENPMVPADSLALAIDGDTTASDTVPAYYIWGTDTIDLAQTTTEMLWDSLFLALRDKDTIGVAMLLPLYLHDTLDPPVRSYAYLPFMEGWLTALSERVNAPDSLLPAVRYRIWDVTDSPESVDRALNDPDLAQADFLIAAVYTKVFDTICRFAQAHRLPLIHPLTEQDSTAAGHPFFVQCLPAYETQAAAMATFLQREFPLERYRYVMFDDSTAFYRKRAQQLYARLAPDTNEIYDIWHYSLSAARMGQLEPVFESLFAAGSARPTVFIGCTDKEIALLNTLIALRKIPGVTEKIFIGPSRWMSFTKIEPEYFKQLRLICYQPFYWDKTGDASLAFERHYFAHFGVLPLDLAYKGYTCFHWFHDMLRMGTVTADPYGRNRWRTRAGGGWENTRLFWLELKDHAFGLWPEPESEPDADDAFDADGDTDMPQGDQDPAVAEPEQNTNRPEGEEEGGRPRRNRAERK